jgi:tetratricopeptide (TPR) repeat protein
MKAKRRHELHENVLSAELVQIIEFAKKRGAAIVVGLLILALVGLVVAWAYGKAREKRENLQLQLERTATDATLTPTERITILEGLAGQDDDKRIAAGAFIALGNEFFSRMIVAGPRDATEWRVLYDRAASDYRSVINSYPDQKPSVLEAHLGLGKLAETLGDFDAARSEYQTALRMTELSGHPAIRRVQDSLDQLEDLARPILMASTRPAGLTTAPATQPSTAPGETAPTDRTVP